MWKPAGAQVPGTSGIQWNYPRLDPHNLHLSYYLQRELVLLAVNLASYRHNLAESCLFCTHLVNVGLQSHDFFRDHRH